MKLPLLNCLWALAFFAFNGNAAPISFTQYYENFAAGSPNEQAFHLVNFESSPLLPQSTGNGTVTISLYNADTDSNNGIEFLEIYADNFLLVVADQTNTAPLVRSHQLSAIFNVVIPASTLTEILSDGLITWGFRGFGVADLGPGSQITSFAQEAANIELSYSVHSVGAPSGAAILVLLAVLMFIRRPKPTS